MVADVAAANQVDSWPPEVSPPKRKKAVKLVRDLHNGLGAVAGGTTARAHLTAHDVGEIDAAGRAALKEISATGLIRYASKGSSLLFVKNRARLEAFRIPIATLPHRKSRRLHKETG